MRVLIIKTSSLGDVVHALPVIDYLHQVCPGVEIEWVLEERFVSVLEHNPRLTRIHVIKTPKWRKAPFSRETRHDLRELRMSLREKPYDLLFDIQGNLKSGLLAWLSAAPKRLGFSKEALQEKLNAFFTTRQIPFRNSDYHAMDRYLRVISVPFGKDYVGMNLTGTIFSAPHDEAAADSFMAGLPGNGLVFFFQVGTTWSTKLWSPQGWCELAKKIAARYPDSTILINWGSAEEKELGEQIVREAAGSAQLLPWLRINELIPVIRRVDLVIGGDTGPVYLAAAVGTPTLSYYRATSAARYAPRGPNHRAVQAQMSCAGCGLTSCERNDICCASITVETLFEAVTDLMT